MASFFRSFRGSAMSKRLLRFAISKLDILDDSALDLDNVDLAFGLNNTLEFRDVAILTKVRGFPAMATLWAVC